MHESHGLLHEAAHSMMSDILGCIPVFGNMILNFGDQNHTRIGNNGSQKTVVPKYLFWFLGNHMYFGSSEPWFPRFGKQCTCTHVEQGAKFRAIADAGADAAASGVGAAGVGTSKRGRVVISIHPEGPV